MNLGDAVGAEELVFLGSTFHLQATLFDFCFPWCVNCHQIRS